jgi:hypothetical protein
MVSVLASSAEDCGFEPWSGQTEDYKIDICYFSAKHAALRRKIKDWLAQNQDNMSEWGDMSIHGLLFLCASTNKFTFILLPCFLTVACPESGTRKTISQIIFVYAVGVDI